MYYNPFLLSGPTFNSGLVSVHSAGVAVSLQPTLTRRAVPLFGIAHIK